MPDHQNSQKTLGYTVPVGLNRRRGKRKAVEKSTNPLESSQEQHQLNQDPKPPLESASLQHPDVIPSRVNHYALNGKSATRVELPVLDDATTPAPRSLMTQRRSCPDLLNSHLLQVAKPVTEEQKKPQHRR